MKKIGIIVTDDSKTWKEDVGLGKYILKRLTDNSKGDIPFQIFYAVREHLPSTEQLHKFHGFIISGSKYSVNDQFQWIDNLKQFVIQVTNLPATERPKLFGICFGHQIIASALGGQVQNMCNKFIFGAEMITIENTLSDEDYFKKLFSGATFKIMQCHGEEVTQLPSKAISVGQSHTCTHEVLKYGNYILSTQGHPEFTVSQMTSIMLPVIKDRNKLSEKELEESVRSFQNVDTDILVRLILTFLTASE